MKNSKRTGTRKPQTRLGGAVTSGLVAYQSEAELEAALTAKMEGARYRLTPQGEAYLAGYRDAKGEAA